jgi:hypothetical protein
LSENSSQKSLHIEERLHELDLRLQKKLGTHSYDVQTLKLRYVKKPDGKASWVDFKTYLENYVNDADFHPTWSFGEQGSAALLGWYGASGRPFRFMDFPVEIRQKVYLYLIGRDIYPKKRSASSLVPMSLGSGYYPFNSNFHAAVHMSEEAFSTMDPNDIVPAPNQTAAWLNKQLREEVYDFVWHSTRLNFSRINNLNDIVSMKSFIPSYALRRIGLNFDNGTYLAFFGVGELTLHCEMQLTFIMAPVNGEPTACVLYDGRLPNLTKLDIKFHSTRYAPWTDPWSREWGDATGRTHYGLNSRSIPVLPRQCLSPCQRKTTEIILALALEYVFHIDQVSLEGDVKYSTMKEFERAMREKKQDPHCEPYWSVTRAQIFDSGTPRPYVHRVFSKLACTNICSPPVCHCAVACYPENYLVDYYARYSRRRGNLPVESIDKVIDYVREYRFSPEDH